MSGVIELLIGALRQWKCPSCGGEKTYLNRSRAFGEERLPCKVCGATGLHPTAAQALADVELHQGVDLYAHAVMFATRDKPSTSYVQRKLCISYNLAVEFMTRMEHAGLVSSPDRAGARRILVAWADAYPAASKP